MMKIYNSTNQKINRAELINKLRKHAPYANTDSEVVKECEKKNLCVSVHDRVEGRLSYVVSVDIPKEKIIF